MWTTLNEKGKEKWGQVFPDSKVPVLDMDFSETNIGRAVLINWKALTETQRNTILHLLRLRFEEDFKEIFAEIEQKDSHYEKN